MTKLRLKTLRNPTEIEILITCPDDFPWVKVCSNNQTRQDYGYYLLHPGESLVKYDSLLHNRYVYEVWDEAKLEDYEKIG